MRKSLLKILSLVFLICLAVSCIGVGTVLASTTVSQDYNDQFSGKSFADKWEVNGAELYTEYSALRIVEANVWTPGINLVGHKVTANSVITFDARFISGQWLGVGFGLYSQTGKFPAANSAVLFTGCPIAGKEYGQTQMMTKSSSELSASTITQYNTYESVFAGANKTVSVKIQIDDNGVISIYSALKGEQPKFIGSYENCFTEGYMALSAMGNTCVDITAFTLDIGGENVYTADFDKDTVSYSSTGFDANSNWYVSSSHWRNTNACIENVNYVKVSQNDFLSYKTPIVDNGVSEVTFRASFTATISSLEEGAFFGVGLGRTGSDSALTERSFVGVGRRGDIYYFAHLIGGELYEVKGSYFGAVLGVGGGSLNLTLEGLYGNRLRLSFGGESLEFTNVNYNGLLAIGCLVKEDGATSAVSFDDFTMEKATHRISLNDDVSNDFKGLKTWVVDDYEYKDYYINKHEYYLGSSVKSPRYGTDAYGNFVDRHYVQFINSNNLSVFAPKKDYGDFVLRFSFTVSGDNPLNQSADARIGFVLGMPSIYYSPTESPFFCFQKGVGENALAVGRNMLDENGLSNDTNDTDYNVWSDQPETYNVMAVVEDGKVKVYYKKDSEPESMMNVLRHTFTTDNTFGYVGVFGYDGSTFTMTDFSITNLTPEKYNDVIEGTVDDARLDVATELTNGKALVSDQSYDSFINFTKVTIKDQATLDLQIGGKTLSLTKTGLVYDQSQINLELNNFDYSALKNKVLIRTQVVGDTFEIGVRSNGSESQLYQAVIKGKLIEKQADAKLSLTVKEGNVTVSTFKTLSLESEIPLKTHNYDEAYENSFNKIVLKPEKGEVSGANQPNWVLIIAISGAAVAAVGVAVVVILVVRKKKCLK